ncbi:Type 1 glutamine amidotransferase-like domain-containing protein [Cellulomonas endometrii]|uniref:Type 1 glutamine amidotransferase-like domain-containing protein n=1 Tax=Cellulomonas endometrii TaxID=3036301 RepID=UPI0024AD12BC|nr:Type 1 glutamine amidotransferase-like domain-containing protein [Cellulomonas endometrii]
MKLLLTSSGLADQLSCDALAALSGRPLVDQRVAVVPTAANVVEGDKGWLLANYVDVQRAGFAALDIVDVSALEPAVWRPRLWSADVLVVTGGDTTHLLRWLRRSGLADDLPALLRDRVYVGISAGSMVTGPHVRLSQSIQVEPDDSRGLGLVDFLIVPHLDSPWFPAPADGAVRAAVAGLAQRTFALADGAAVVVSGADVRVVGTGRHLDLMGGRVGGR